MKRFKTICVLSLFSIVLFGCGNSSFKTPLTNNTYRFDENKEVSRGNDPTYTVAPPRGRYYEYCSNDAGITTSSTAPSHPYDMPTEVDRVTRSENGGLNAGILTVTGSGLQEQGLLSDEVSPDYVSYGVSSSVSLSFTFHAVTSIGDASKQYHITDCPTTELDGFSLKGRIGTGAVLVLKRYKGDSTWRIVADNLVLNNRSDGDTFTFTPDAKDIQRGCYYRFVSAYQYSYFWRQVWPTNQYLYNSILQRLTVYLGSLNNSIRFISEPSPMASHNLSTTLYEAEIKNDVISLNNSTKVARPSICTNPLSSNIYFKGEVIRSGDDDLTLDNNIPVYSYNGSRDLYVNYVDRTSQASSYSTAYSKEVTVNTYHYVSKDTSTSTIQYLGRGVYIVEALNEQNGIKEFIQIGQDEGVGTIRISPLSLVNYSIFRFMHLFTASINGKLYVEANIAYFKIVIQDKSSSSAKIQNEGERTVSNLAALSSTLDDNSAVFSSFSVTSSANVLEYAYNDSSYKKISGGYALFSEPGKYHFRSTNTFSESYEATIYLLQIGDDLARSQLFETQFAGFLDQNGRVYDSSSAIPCYKIGTRFSLIGSIYRPGLYGTISRVLSDGSLKTVQSFDNLHSKLSGVFNEEGQYLCEFTVGDKSAKGDKITYAISFRIVNGDNYTPIVNKSLLESGVLSSSYATKVYTVTLKSQGNGSFKYVYPLNKDGENKALSLATNIEYHYVEALEDNKYRYNNEEYISKFKLYDALKENAKKRINEEFVDSSKYLNNGEYHINNIFSVSLEEDRYVVESEDILSSLVVHPIIINGFKFTQLREYECQSVTMTHIESGKKYDIPFDVEVDTVLEESGKYLVKEVNHCGTSEYEVAYFANGENLSIFDLHYYVNDKIVSHIVSQKDSYIALSSSAFCFTSITNEFDGQDIVTITDGNGLKKQYLMNELTGLIIDDTNQYNVEIRGRLGNGYSFTLNVTGNGSVHGAHKDIDHPLLYRAMEESL